MDNDFASIARDPLTKAAALSVGTEGEWALYAGKSEKTVDFSAPLAAGCGPQTLPVPLAAPAWACFALRVGGKTLYLAERRLPMQGGFNFRDLGGFTGEGGKHVRWGQFLRTDGLEKLTDGDLKYLTSIPVSTLVDFRTLQERERSPDRIPETVKTVLHRPIAPGYLNPDGGKPLDFAAPDAFMMDMYRDLALDRGITAAYKDFFAQIQAGDGPPVMFHCSAGKDRTGVAAALLLFALGVDRETVLHDYEQSNVFLAGKYDALLAVRPELRGLLTVKRDFLEEALALIEREHGSITRYLETALDVNIATMRRRFLL